MKWLTKVGAASLGYFKFAGHRQDSKFGARVSCGAGNTLGEDAMKSVVTILTVLALGAATLVSGQFDEDTKLRRVTYYELALDIPSMI